MYGDRGVYFDCVAIQRGWLVAPVLHGLQCRLHQERVPRNDLKFADLAILVDDCVQHNVARNAGLPRQWRIDRVRTRNHLGFLHVTANLDGSRRLWRRRWWWRSSARSA